jgi:hypothetical protein
LFVIPIFDTVLPEQLMAQQTHKEKEDDLNIILFFVPGAGYENR